MSSRARACRASSAEMRHSCSFSPGRMPVTRISQPGGVDDGLRPEDIGLDRLERVVLACRHLLHCRCVDDDVDVGLEGALEALLIAYVSDEERESRVAELELHVVLLQLVAAQHDDALG